MNVLITGANGFIGRALTRRLLTDPSALALGLGAMTSVTSIDLTFGASDHAQVRQLAGSIIDGSLLDAAFDRPIDLVFHLASVPGGTAEQQYDLGKQVNLDATLALLDKARAQATVHQKPPVFVFASSIAVLGSPLPARVDDATPPRPRLSYGAHKWIGEILLEDFHRRGWIDARCIRLPGIVARPPQRTGQYSAFMSDIIRELAAGRPYVCPVSAESTTWLMSVHCIVDNLLHAATLRQNKAMDRRVWTLPALRSSMNELVAAIAQVYRTDAAARVSFQCNPDLEANFGCHPPLFTLAADDAGFRHDGDLRTLVKRALLPIE